MARPYIAASSYLNTAPLCYAFIHGSQEGRCYFVSDASPARAAELLKTGTADAAMIPVIEYQRIDGIKIAPGACVASKNQVRSVVLASKVPIENVNRVALDAFSRTSSVLVRILLERFYGRAPLYKSAEPDLARMLDDADSALIIGDPAMLVDQSRLFVYDLAEEWKKHTGLPFVFAFWAIRPESAGSLGRAGIDFAEALREGLLHIDEIAQAYSTDLGLPKIDLFEYLTRNLSFDLDEDCLRGLELFYTLARESGQIEKIKPVEFS